MSFLELIVAAFILFIYYMETGLRERRNRVKPNVNSTPYCDTIINDNEIILIEESNRPNSVLEKQIHGSVESGKTFSALELFTAGTRLAVQKFIEGQMSIQRIMERRQGYEITNTDKSVIVEDIVGYLCGIAGKELVDVVRSRISHTFEARLGCETETPVDTYVCVLVVTRFHLFAFILILKAQKPGLFMSLLPQVLQPAVLECHYSSFLVKASFSSLLETAKFRAAAEKEKENEKEGDSGRWEQM